MQGRKDEDHSYLEGYCDAGAWTAGLAERAFVRYLDGGCSSPVAAYGEVSGDELTLTGLYYRENDGTYIKGSIRGPVFPRGRTGRGTGAEIETIKRKRRTVMKMGKVWLVGRRTGRRGAFYSERAGGPE